MGIITIIIAIKLNLNYVKNQIKNNLFSDKANIEILVKRSVEQR